MSKIVLKAGTAAAVAVISLSAQAQWAGLGNYALVGNYALPALSPSPPTASSSKEFEASAQREPNRLRGYYGAARAAVR